jgi:hypothetical protein
MIRGGGRASDMTAERNRSSVGKEVAMAVQESVEQRAARTHAHKDLLASQSATLNVTPPQQEGSVAIRKSGVPGKHRETQLAGNAEHVARTTTLIAGGAILVAVALFAAGFMRTGIEQALRRFVERVEEVEVPVLLPLTIAETVRELRTDMRIMSETRADQREV